MKLTRIAAKRSSIASSSRSLVEAEATLKPYLLRNGEICFLFNNFGGSELRSNCFYIKMNEIDIWRCINLLAKNHDGWQDVLQFCTNMANRDPEKIKRELGLI